MTPIRMTSAANVRNAIAQAVLMPAEPVDPALGTIQLHPHQLDAVQRLRAAITRHGGALLADEVGLGKTYVALAVARTYPRTCLLAPAALLPMWRSALRMAGTSDIDLRSLQAMSRSQCSLPTLDPHALIIIDEAHHLRTRTTRRYQRAAQLSAAHDVLLLTATPLHNAPSELRALLALFLGDRADALDAQSLAALVVRRTHREVPSAQLPAVVEHPAWPVPENTPVLEAILTLPPPLPTRHGSAAGALVRLGLLRAWCSSDAAFADTLRRRRLRGEALLHALAHGRHPTRLELRSWTTGQDAVQLGFPELLVSHAVDDTAGAPDKMLAQVTNHLAALDMLERLHLRTATADATRSALLRNLLMEQPHTPILAFSQFAATVNALYRALADVAGVASLTARGGRVAGGPLSRQEVIARFAPRAHERPPPPTHETIRLLLATDVLSEGVNLQDAGRLVHLDLPWTTASQSQRVGRLARLGAFHREVHVHAIEPPPGADRTLRIVATLARKARLTESLVGQNSLSATHARAVNIAHEPSNASAPESASRLRGILRSWISSEAPCDAGDAVPIGLASARHAGWIAAIRECGQVRVAAHINTSPHSARATLLETPFTPSIAIEAITSIRFDAPEIHKASRPGAVETACIREAWSAVKSLLNDDTVRDLAGPAPVSLSQVRRHLLDLIAQRVAQCPAARRSALLPTAAAAQRAVMRVRGAGAEFSLQQWLRKARGAPDLRWFEEWRQYPALSDARAHSGDPRFDNGSHERDARVLALLVLVPAISPMP